MKGTLIILFQFFTLSLFAQRDSIIVYDFSAGVSADVQMSKTINKVRDGANVVYKIININRFVYDVKIEGAQEEHPSTPSPVFSTIFKKESIDTSGLGEKANQLTESLPDGIENVDVSQAVKILEEEVGSINLMKTSTIEKLGDPNETKKNKAKAKAKIENYDAEIAEHNHKIDGLKAYSILTQDISSLQIYFDQLEQTKELKNRLINISQDSNLTHEKSKDEVKSICSDYSFIQDLEALRNSFNVEYRNFHVSYREYLVAKADEIDKSPVLKKTIQDLYDEAVAVKQKVDAYDYSKLFSEIRDLIRALESESSFFATSAPIQAEKDFMLFKVNISPKEEVKSFSIKDKKEFAKKISIYGAPKTSFSSGVAFMPNLYDRQYTVSVLSESPDSAMITKDSFHGIGKLSLVGMMHTTWRAKCGIEGGFTFGLGINSTEIDLTNLDVFFGGSMVFGKKRHSVVSLGYALTHVDHLKGKYELNTKISSIPPESDLTERVLKGSFFISYSWNFTKSKTQ
jgi:hypothetical protein